MSSPRIINELDVVADIGIGQDVDGDNVYWGTNV